MMVMNDVLGGGLSSRLFQEIREKKGLVYSIYSYHEPFRDTGIFAVHAATSREKYGEVLELIRSEFGKMIEGDISGDELVRMKKQLRSGFLIGLENTSNRMIRMARQRIYLGETYPVEETLKKIDSVTVGDVRALAAEILDAKRMTTAVLGPV